MSLLEDVFLQDEANEAQELERVIEGGDYEERINASNSDDNSEKEDEAEEDKRRVDPTSTKTKRVIKNPRFILNPARLTGPRGIQVIPEHFKDFKFKGKSHEKEDLDLVLKRLEHWAYRLYPKFKFEDCLKKIETLGKKRPVMVHLHKIRSDQLLSEETVIQRDSSDDETPAQQEPDEFDKLLQQQIELARATPAPASAKKSLDDSHIETRALVMPKATSSPSISDEQRERMLRNRRLAEERRIARLNNSNDKNNSNKTNEMIEVDDLESKKGKTNVVDSSEGEGTSESVTVDIKQKHNKSSDNRGKEINESQQKKRKTNIFDSSDEENVRETITVDVQTHTTHMEEKDVSMEMINSITDHIQEDIAKEMENRETDNGKIAADVSSNPIQDDNDEITSQAKSCKERDELNTIEITGNNSKSNILNENVELIMENNIIQSTILGLVENDNNLNLERDLINQDLNEDRLNREAENTGSSNISEQNTDKNEDIMDLDLSDDF